MSEIQAYIAEKLKVLNLKPNDAHMVFFWKPYPKIRNQLDEACCCQWWLGNFSYRDIQFRSAEHAMMYAKAQLFNDKQVMQEILAEPKPSEAKALGRKVRNFSADVWEQHDYEMVKDISFAKFSQLEPLKNWMLSLPDNTLFVEASPYDAIWGIKRADDGRLNLHDIHNWNGKNKLGFALTEAFQKLKRS